MNNTDTHPHPCDQHLGRIIDGFPGNICLNINHPVIRRLSDKDRGIAFSHIKELFDCLPLYSVGWADHVHQSERTAWSTPNEKLLNIFAWDQICWSFPQSLQEDTEEALRELEITINAFGLFNPEDQDCLKFTLSKAAATAYFDRKEINDSVQKELTIWLQDWTESDETDLETLL